MLPKLFKTTLTALTACVLLIPPVNSAAACSDNPPYIPQFLRDALYTDTYKKVDPDDYDHFFAKSTDIKFRTTNDFHIACNMGMPLDYDGTNFQGNRGLLCAGKMPLAGSRLTHMSTYPIPSNKMLVPTAIDLAEASKPAFASGDDTIAEAWEDVKVLPIGSKIWIPKVDPKEWNADEGNSDANNWSMACVVPDQHRVGCLRSDNHGFWLDQYGTHTF